MNTQETNDKQVKRVLRATDLRQMPGIAVQTNVKAGQCFDACSEACWLEPRPPTDACIEGCMESRNCL